MAERWAELGSLFDLYGDEVYRCAVFVGGPDDAEAVTTMVFGAVWHQVDALDHRDPSYRMRLISSCVVQIVGTEADPRSPMVERAVLAVVVSGRCTYREAAGVLGVSEAFVLDLLREAMRRDLMGMWCSPSQDSARSVPATGLPASG